MIHSNIGIRRWSIFLILLANFGVCNAGFFSNIKGFILGRLSRRKSFDEKTLVESSSVLDLRIPQTPSEIVTDLTARNELLRAQVLSLRTFVSMQKRQLSDARKEKDALRRSMALQASKFHEQREVDQEIIKNELRNVFEEEKIVMIASFEEEKDLLKEDYVIEVRDIKLQLTQQLEHKSSELGISSEANSKQSILIADFEKSGREAAKDISELKQALREKESAMVQLSRASAKIAEDGLTDKPPAVAAIKSTKKSTSKGEGSSPTRPAKSTIPGSNASSGTSKSTTSRSRPPMAAGQNAPTSNRSGL